MSTALNYDEFLASKVAEAGAYGFTVAEADLNPILKPHQRDIVMWALRKGRAAIFAAFGLGKSVMQLEIARLVLAHEGGRFLIVAPLGVRQEFKRDGAMLGIEVRFIRRIEDCEGDGVYITNYESVRDGKLDPRQFSGISLDEAACFPAGTQIDTAGGTIPIEQIKVGDRITNASGEDIVSDVFKTRIARAARVTVGGKGIISSDNHPYLTNRGWVAAAELRPGDALVETSSAMRLLREGNCATDVAGSPKAFLQSILLSEMAGYNGARDGRLPARRHGFCRHWESATSSYQSECHVAETEGVRAMRHADDSAPIEAGRWQPPFALSTGSRCEENDFPGISRVESVEILELDHPDLDQFRDAHGCVYFYDLTATRHPSFSVNGLLVHNCLRGLGSTKTFREFMAKFEGWGRFKYVATATPSPNDYIELLAYSAFLDVGDVSLMKTRFFKRDSTKADHLTLHPHKEREFWVWLSTWAIFLQKPSDLSYSDDGYSLPEAEIHWHEVAADHSNAGTDPSGQHRLLHDAAIGVQAAAAAKRNSLPARMAKLMELRALDPDAHRIIWHDLEAERHAIEQAIPSCVTIYGSQDLDERERAVVAFSDGEIQELAGKPIIAGSGCNFQRHCSWAIFLGIGFKFNDFIQSCHRIQRFLQPNRVRIDLIYAESEREIKKVLERKWEQHKALVARMSEVIREYGLATNIRREMGRSIGCERSEYRSEHALLVNNDCVVECRSLESNSAHLILTSIPFSTQYEYSPSYNDFGHSDSNAHFFEQMDFLTPELLRVLAPGRIAAIHVKDRITPGSMTGLGFQTVYPFHAECIAHFQRHGFAYLGMKTIVTDVVRENNQTYRLGWTEQCKDGSRMGVGMPEYLLLFRKPVTDPTRGYADVPVVKNKADYTRSRWQIDAHGFARSSGNRPLTPEDLADVPHSTIFKMFRRYSMLNVYDFEHHVALCESLERCLGCGHIHVGDRSCAECDCPKSGGRLPVTFMLLQPQSWHPDVWSDITRMLTLNGAQSAHGREMHLAPLQFDICDRAITQYTMPGETVLDPFSGIGTVPYRSVRLGRLAVGIELSVRYYRDAIYYLDQAEAKLDAPSLFDLEGIGEDVGDCELALPEDK